MIPIMNNQHLYRKKKKENKNKKQLTRSLKIMKAMTKKRTKRISNSANLTKVKTELTARVNSDGESSFLLPPPPLPTRCFAIISYLLRIQLIFLQLLKENFSFSNISHKSLYYLFNL